MFCDRLRAKEAEIRNLQQRITMIARIRKGNDFKHIWPITWNGQPEDFSDATDITLTATVYGQVKTLVEGVDYHIDGGMVMIDFTPTICDITGTYTVELNYIKPSAEFTDGDRRSAVDVQAFQIVNTSAEANATEGVSLPSEAMAAYALKYDDLTEEQKDELRGKGITSIDLTGEVGDTKTYTITYADGLTFDFSVTDGHTPIFTFVGTVLHIDGVAGPDLKGETGNGIASVELTSTVGLVKTYTITFTDATETTFTVTDGSTPEITFQGTTIYVDGVAGPDLKGEAGRGITSVELLSTVGLAKTYRITFTDATTYDYVVTDGAAGTGATVVQTTGGSLVDVMSQKAVTDEIAQLAGEVSLLDAVQGAKIKDIESIISTMNPNQSAQINVTGVSPLSLPKNAANSGMSVKLEGLTEDVGGVITNFEPTGRVRSVDKSGLNPTHLYLTAPELRSNGTVKDEIRKGTNGYELVKRVGVGVVDGAIVPTNATQPVGWAQLMSGWTLADGVLNCATSTAGMNADLYANLVVGKIYKVELTLNITTGNIIIGASGEVPYYQNIGGNGVNTFIIKPANNRSSIRIQSGLNGGFYGTISNISVREITVSDGYPIINGGATVIGSITHYTLATPVISPISYGGILNSAENGTVYHEPVVADAGVYDTKMDILLTDYPISALEEIIKHENGVDTYLNAATAVIAVDGLSFTHPNLASGDLVLFTYAYNKETTNGNITATFYDSNVVKIDTVTGKAYRINEVVTNGVLTRTITEV